MGRQKVKLDQLVVPGGTPDGQVPATVAGELVLTEAPSGGGTLIASGSLPAAADHVDELAVLTYSGTVASDPMLGADGLHPTLAGMTHLADAYVGALAAAGKTPAAATPVYAYGDSWTAQNLYVTVEQKAINQLVSRLGLGTLNNQAVGGHKLADVAVRAIGNYGVAYPAGTNALAVVANAGLNDLTQADTAVHRAAITNGLRAMLAALSAAERIEQTSFTYAGTWATTAFNFTAASGGTNANATGEGATATYTITTPGTYYLLTHGGMVGSTRGKIIVSQSGTTLAEVDLHEQGYATGNLVSAAGPHAVRIPDVQAGSLTMTFTRAGRTNADGWVDALVRVSPTPPTILLAKPVPVLDASYQNPSLLTFVRDLYDSMAAEFGPHVVVADPSPGWAPDGQTDASADPELWFSDGSIWKQPTAAGGSAGSAPAATDVTVSPTGNIAATNVQAALAELDSEKIATSEKGAAGGVATLGADGKVPAGQLPSATAGTAAGTSFAPTTSIAATNVQAAVEELAAETLPTAAVGAPGGVASLGTDGKVPSSQLPAPSSGGGGSTGKDPRWTVPSGLTSIDEFSDDTLDAGWVRADAAGTAANVTWTESRDVLSAYNSGGDALNAMHGLVRPIGSALAAGDAFVTCMSLMAPLANYSMGGLVLTDNPAHGSGTQVFAQAFSSTAGLPVETWPGTGWTAGSAAMNQSFAASLAHPNRARLYLRLVMTAANTWRIDISPDGVSWLKGTAAARTLTPTHVGLLSSSWGSANKSVASYEFLRRVAGVS